LRRSLPEAKDIRENILAAPRGRSKRAFFLALFPLDTIENMGYKIGLSARGKSGDFGRFLIFEGKGKGGGLGPRISPRQQKHQSLPREVSFIQFRRCSSVG
jgi:hypothetical protein